MRPAPAALVNWLATSRLLTAYDLWTFQLAGGEVLRYSGASLALQIPGSLWAANSGSLNYSASATWTFALGPVFQRGRVKCKVGVEAQPLEVTIGAGPADLIGPSTGSGLSWQQAIYARLFDGAIVELDRFFPGPSGPTDTSIGCLVWFYGSIGAISWGRTAIRMTVNTPLAALANTQMPRRIYGANCTHAFGSPMCGYDRTGGKNAAGQATGLGAVNVTAGAPSTPIAILTSFTPNPSTAYDEGTIIGTSGANNGFTRTIKTLSGGTANLNSPFVYPVATGDGFTLLPGCDHTVTTCQNTFNNLARFGGFPAIPPPESVV
ncbi:MAG TPA: DUF2163 domain-containing protein [Stellaceae bacterium]|nr:DUF2163 domain-containing protein [Stellaceae bacterium]